MKSLNHARMMLAIPLLVLLPLSASHAELPDVIGVLTNDLNEQGDLSLAIHVNATMHGANEQPSYPGEVLNNHGTRITPMISYGLRDNLELSLSAPLVREGGGNNITLAGGRGRLTWIAPGEERKKGFWYWGASTSLLATQEKYEYGKMIWDAGLIGGYNARNWHAATNIFASNGLSNGQQHQAPDISIDAKYAYRVANETLLGAELEASHAKTFSTVDGTTRVSTRTFFGTLDLEGEKHSFHFGLGHGMNSDTDRWTLKFGFFTPL